MAIHMSMEQWLLSATIISISLFYYYHRLPWISRLPMSTKISDTVFGYCTNSTSVSSKLSKDTSKTAGQHAEELYSHSNNAALATFTERHPASKAELERARACGNWGNSEPSDLFLQCYHAALCSLEHDPLAGMISPSLMGSHGILPLTIIAPLPEIVRHMSNLIARAQKEVFLATNYWIASDASRYITDALVELSNRARARGEKVVVKIMYDRGSAKQVLDNHQIVSPGTYATGPVKLPAPEDIPNIDMQVQNYHRPMLGTFHSKFMVVDRRVGIVQSNNIQDNDNLEMMTHIEGPIVDSLYDTAMLAWEREMEPQMPYLQSPASLESEEVRNERAFGKLGTTNGVSVETKDTEKRRDSIEVEDREALHPHTIAAPHYDKDIRAEIRRTQAILEPCTHETKREAVTRYLNVATKQNRKGFAPECSPEDDFLPMIAHKLHDPFPMALMNRKPFGAPNNEHVIVPQNEAWLAAIRNAESFVFIQTPNLNAAPLLPALEEAVQRGVTVTYYVCLGYNDAGEMLPFQGGTNEQVASRLCQNLDLESRQRLNIHYYVAKDQTAPIHNKFKARSCHVKLMIVDGHVGIIGNGNQDTQSWFHSMEVNLMIDSKEVCGDWIEGIRRNQNTHIYGAASQSDGIWRNGKGEEAEGAMGGKDPGRLAWAKGMVGAVQRVRGKGGF
ncbi:phospholipase D active site motif protein [Aaosphaeria arxii CBS 175.79]|uniref:Phospholipase D active site motif protein n=1 Tax=Aaosphaeria arxii CBS 175.79 TaxID=1450172 RepID=A0A6A5XSQ9_9PLEO|nr:phospholipase D active site motif protein [Aaosphaeria arxii CBS 175.79]KAF2015791.1 phospholipase D active site motif protein [Aaosphaeria arxii CBS 175.79]